MMNPKNLSFQAYQLIKDRIIRNKIVSRQKLNEIELSKELRLSRTPIREALIMLEKEDLITRHENDRGFYVKPLSIKDIYDLYEFRRILEIAAANLVLKHLDARKIENLSEALIETKKIIEKNDPADALLKGMGFHIAFVELCENNMIINALSSCSDKLFLICASCKDIDTPIKSFEEHEVILSVLKTGNISQLTKIIDEHVIQARDRAINILKKDLDRLYYLP